MRNLLPALSLAVAALVPQRGAAQTFRGRATSRDGSVVVSWSVQDGYKIDVAIDTPKKKGAYRVHREGDVSNMHADFLDANGDGRPDVLLKYEDESGYSPDVLINRNDESFVDALQLKEGFLVEEEQPTSPQKAYPLARWRLVAGPGRPTELVFDHVVIGDTRYGSATFQLDPRALRYRLVAKGKALGKVRSEDDAL